jgi:phage N-6-adenine-methyltransferase
MGFVKSKTPPGERNLWRTPDFWFEKLNREYGPFTLDAAADQNNHKCLLWLGPGSGKPDALVVDWCNYDGTPARVFCNPPYDYTEAFIAKGWEEVSKGHVHSVTFVVPATTDVAWFHKYVWGPMWRSSKDYRQGDPEVTLDFSRGRIQFLRPNGEKAGSPHCGSAFVTFTHKGA